MSPSFALRTSPQRYCRGWDRIVTGDSHGRSGRLSSAPCRPITLSAFSLLSFAGGIAGDDERPAAWLPGPLPARFCSAISASPVSCSASGRLHERRSRRLAQRPGRPGLTSFIGQLGGSRSAIRASRATLTAVSCTSAADEQQAPRPQTSLGLRAPVGPSSPLRLRSGGRQTRVLCDLSMSPLDTLAVKRLLHPNVDGLKHRVGHEIYSRHGTDTEHQKLARLSQRVASKVVGALERRGYDIRAKMNGSIR